MKCDGEVREDREDRRGLVRRRLQVQEQGHGADRRHQEVRGVRGRSHHQKDCSEGDQDAQGGDTRMHARTHAQDIILEKKIIYQIVEIMEQSQL